MYLVGVLVNFVFLSGFSLPLKLQPRRVLPELSLLLEIGCELT